MISCALLHAKKKVFILSNITESVLVSLNAYPKITTKENFE
jgi:hypothetical protein